MRETDLSLDRAVRDTGATEIFDCYITPLTELRQPQTTEATTGLPELELISAAAEPILPGESKPLDVDLYVTETHHPNGNVASRRATNKDDSSWSSTHRNDGTVESLTIRNADRSQRALYRYGTDGTTIESYTNYYYDIANPKAEPRVFSTTQYRPDGTELSYTQFDKFYPYDRSYVKTFHSDGKTIESSTNYFRGQRLSSTSYRPDGSRASETTFRNDKPESVTIYDEKGKPQSVRIPADLRMQ